MSIRFGSDISLWMETLYIYKLAFIKGNKQNQDSFDTFLSRLGKNRRLNGL